MSGPPPDVHAGQPLRHAGRPLAEAGAAMILVHGRGATAESILLTHNTVRVTGNAAMALGDDAPALRLTLGPGDGYHCDIGFRGQALTFGAPTAGEAYAQALLHVLEQRNRPNGV